MLHPRKLSILPALVAVAALTPSEAGATDLGYAIHLEGSAARTVGPDKSEQFGWGGGGIVAPELTLGRHVGVELLFGGLALSDGGIDEPGLVPTQGGYGLFTMPGLRLRPFGRADGEQAFDPGGLWIGGGGGVAYTGGLTRPAFDARLGYDLHASAAFRAGPSIGFMQILETDNPVRPNDARMMTFGFHGAFEPAGGPIEPSDRDADGLGDDVDDCPDDPEDRDGFEDEDGCPDLDDDRDGILDPDDLCPRVAEDEDGFEDTDGCPDPDNDQDGIADDDDRCPDDPEDVDTFEDEDGCPDPDNDQDGIADVDDSCPLEAETENGYADDDGCPDEVQVRVVGDEILLDDRVHFAVNLADIHVQSWPLLERVAKLLKDNPTYAVVRIQGHADDTGAEEYNYDLSVRRAKSVRDMLVGYGVDPDRLVVEGFGENRPRIDDTSVHARHENRRVEFLILERNRELRVLEESK